MNNSISGQAIRRGWWVSVFLLVVALSLSLLAASATGAPESGLPAWQEPRLIKNILAKTASSATYPLAEMNGQLFFVATNQGIEQNYSELWRTDGTPGGTILLERRDDTTFSPLFVLGDKLLFLAPHPDYGNELWITDGTPGNAHAMGDAFPGPFDGYVADHIVSGNYLYFTAYDDVNLTELWRSDGTVAGTIRLTGPDLGLDVGFPGAFIDFNGTLFFQGQTPENEPLLLKSNGTVAGTTVVKELPPTFGGKQVVAGNLLYVLGSEIWRSDGTAAGTYLIHTMPAGRFIDESGAVAAADSKVYFVTRDESYHFELWQTMGTAATTTKITALPGFYGRMATVGDRLFFVGVDQAHGNELWTSDGTLKGTLMVKDVRPGDQGANIDKLVAAGNHVYFAADTDTQYGALWRSDGTAAGTNVVPIIGAPSSGPMTTPLAPLGDELFFQAEDDSHGREPWVTTNNGASAVFLKDINVIDSLSSMPGAFNYANNTLFFSTTEGLWKSDGSEAATSLLVPSISQHRVVLGYPTGISGNKLYFLIEDHPSSTVELWRTDGTTGGTALVKTIGEMHRPDPITAMTDVNGLLYFARDNHHELWRSDGTPGGTVHVATPNPILFESSAIGQIVGVGNVAYFVATDGSHGRELWRSDGSTGGTAMVADIVPGAAGSDPTDLTALGAHVYFIADDGSHGRELWRSDGTATGTYLARDVKPGPESSEPAELTPFKGAVYFAADDGTHGRELWRSDGTAAGTTLVKDTPTAGGSAPRELTAGDNWLFFLAMDEANLQPWKSNGTAAGTKRITAVAYGEGFYPQNLATVGDKLFFTVGNNADTGVLYQSDGTAAGTINLSDAFPDFRAYNVAQLTPAPGRLFFSATHLFYGNEPFMQIVELTRQTPAQLYLAEGAGFAHYQLRLTFRPAAPVTIRFTADDPTVELSPASVVIQPANWNTPVAIGVRAAPDDAEVTRAATITQSFESADSTLNGAVTTMPISIGWRFAFAPVVSR